MATAIDVARVLARLWKASVKEDISHARLQRLLFHVQGWYLALFARPLFDARIVAQPSGPVFSELLVRSGEQAILAEGPDGSASLSEGERRFVRAVWEEYQPNLDGVSADSNDVVELSREIAPGEEIPACRIRDFFLAKLEEKGLDAAAVAAVYNGIEEMASGRKRSHAEVFARLRVKA